MWIFGYGSLLWKPDFPYEERVVGHVRGFKRRFWLINTDHRGVPEKPGRVATLVEDPDHLVWGEAFKVSQKDVEDVCRRLAVREKDYEFRKLTFHPRDGDRESFDINLYITPPEHTKFRPAKNNEIAQDIKQAVGFSGENTEYLLRLAEYIRINIPEDDDKHLFQLEEFVQIPAEAA